MTPVRVQRRREKGWRMPANTVYVGRPTLWGNSARIGECGECRWGRHEGEHGPMTAQDTVDEYRILWEASAGAEAAIGRMTAEEVRLTGVSGIALDLFEDIRGKNLACWCPIDQPCHADVLLELANRSQGAAEG